jgi:hypothetical protein
VYPVPAQLQLNVAEDPAPETWHTPVFWHLHCVSVWSWPPVLGAVLLTQTYGTRHVSVSHHALSSTMPLAVTFSPCLRC